jgi:hypothetical protein
MNRCIHTKEYLMVFTNKENYQHQLNFLFDTNQIKHLHQLEDLARLADGALKERDTKEHQDAETR